MEGGGGEKGREGRKVRQRMKGEAEHPHKFLRVGAYDPER